MFNVMPESAYQEVKDRYFNEREVEAKTKVAHACEQPGAMHFYGGDGRCVFCECHRDAPRTRELSA